MNTAFNGNCGLTVTLSSSYWYLQGFDLSALAEYVDWFNVMAYDNHGTWDGQTEYSSSVINPHTNLTGRSRTRTTSLWRNNIDPSQVVLGLGFYGRSFTLADTSCNTPGCDFAGGGDGGSCTGTVGILSDYEISRVLEKISPDVTYDAETGVNWVSFDNARSLRQNADFANSKCLGGLFSWALDLGGPRPTTNPNDLSLADTSMDDADTSDGGASEGSGDIYLGLSVYPSDDGDFSGHPPIYNGSRGCLEHYNHSHNLWGYHGCPRDYHASSSGDHNYSYPCVKLESFGDHNDDSHSLYCVSQLPVAPIITLDNPNPMSSSGVTHPPVTRTYTIPPWPWSTGITDFLSTYPLCHGDLVHPNLPVHPDVAENAISSAMHPAWLIMMAEIRPTGQIISIWIRLLIRNAKGAIATMANSRWQLACTGSAATLAIADQVRAKAPVASGAMAVVVAAHASGSRTCLGAV
ncbi:glycosyl hydrolases family 18-domain-containing protein [Aspergillus cavernicola]|uniref:chitinase n=1 Tax=Aspergillus cavernicola TaxID=176166 RepID=A0ABR4IVQ9_9EURO